MQRPLLGVLLALVVVLSGCSRATVATGEIFVADEGVVQRFPKVTVGIYSYEDAKAFEQYVAEEAEKLNADIGKMFENVEKMDEGDPQTEAKKNLQNTFFRMRLGEFSQVLLKGPKGTPKATVITDEDGRFSVTVPDRNHRLIASVTYSNGDTIVTMLAWSLPQNKEGVHKLTDDTAFCKRKISIAPF